MLAAARDLVRHHVPLVGINQGRLGFMTDIGHDDMQTGIGAILDGKYAIEERSLLDAEIRARRQVDAAHHRAQRGGDRQGLAGPADRVRAARRRRVRLPPARRRHHRRHADRLDRVCALGAGPDPASRGARAHAGAAQPAHAVGAAGQRERPQRDRDRDGARARRARALRRPRAARHGRGRPPDPQALGRRGALRAPAGLPATSPRCARSWAGAKRSRSAAPRTDHAARARSPGLRHRRARQPRARHRLHRAHRRDRRRQVDPGRRDRAAGRRPRRRGAGARGRRARRAVRGIRR